MKIKILLLIMCSLIFVACKKDDSIIETNLEVETLVDTEEEVIVEEYNKEQVINGYNTDINIIMKHTGDKYNNIDIDVVFNTENKYIFGFLKGSVEKQIKEAIYKFIKLPEEYIKTTSEDNIIKTKVNLNEKQALEVLKNNDMNFETSYSKIMKNLEDEKFSRVR